MKHYATSKIFARPLFPFGLRPSGKSGQSRMYLTPDSDFCA